MNACLHTVGTPTLQPRLSSVVVLVVCARSCTGDYPHATGYADYRSGR